ncbi:MAG: hypothetical protein BWY01_00536 [Synergistetes bacterium ADurb.Bin155]|nr:MAG: hypothetical protein BWY01_00536 [Synergistetes bacterium ADurb.Bin155]
MARISSFVRGSSLFLAIACHLHKKNMPDSEKSGPYIPYVPAVRNHFRFADTEPLNNPIRGVGGWEARLLFIIILVR